MFDSLDDDYEYGHEWDLAENMAIEAFELYEQGQMGQALEKLGQAIELGPDHGAWYFNAALTLDGLEEYEKAIDYYKRALEFNHEDIEILNCLGVDYTRTTHYDLALRTFEQIEYIQPDFEPAYCNRIITYTEMEQHDKAEQMFYLAQQINPDCAICFYNIGNSLYTQGNYEKALWCWDKCAELDPKHPQIHYRLAQVCWVSGNGVRARSEFLTELRQNPIDLDVILDFGLFLLESGDLEAAKEKFIRILEFDENFALAKFYLAEVYFIQSNVSAANQWYQRAMESDRHLVGARFRLAQLCLQNNELLAGIELLRQELELGVDDNDVLSSIGWLFVEMGDQPDASVCFLQILDRDDSNEDAFFGLGVSMALNAEYEGASECFNHAIQLDPDRPEIVLCAAWTCCKLRLWTQALEYVRQCQATHSRFEPYRSRCRELKRSILFRKTVEKLSLLIRRLVKKTHV